MTVKTYSISELARELDVTTRTIRFYEEQGMLAPTRRGLERIYTPKDLVALKLILRGKRIGFSLAECKSLIELYDPQGDNHYQLNIMLKKIYERRLQLEQQLLDIQQMQLELDTAEERCHSALLEISESTNVAG
ncbi:MerR family DNA-binding transcriptional regulator [Pseudomonas sp. P105]|uniref:MerR family transcriptional regulator n=1 Tax=Pseudomonas sp. P105 TaxID=3049542 RepID=UPI0029345D4A|nr:MerR family DNA-binding transcriptional regulator [Pseudomonas sp. P105]WNZ80920.1 MerR family DNA-binding transcriptional regulator [Pseudomonas sp. P105]